MSVKNYYPWNLQALADWIQQEIENGISRQHLESKLEISSEVMRQWLTTPASESLTAIITLAQLQSIARYRQWTVDKTAQWLDIRSAHLEEMAARAAKLDYGLKPSQ